MAKDAFKFMEELNSPFHVGKLLRAHRTGWDMSQKDLAKKLGVTVGFISNIETGKKGISLDKLLEFCRKLNENEKFWMVMYFKEEARKAGKEITIKLEDIKSIKRTKSA